jgi:hypothetical protein
VQLELQRLTTRITDWKSAAGANWVEELLVLASVHLQPEIAGPCALGNHRPAQAAVGDSGAAIPAHPDVQCKRLFGAGVFAVINHCLKRKFPHVEPHSRIPGMPGRSKPPTGPQARRSGPPVSDSDGRGHARGSIRVGNRRAARG